MPRLPLDQFRRLERAALQIERGTTPPPLDEGTFSPPVLSQWMLNEQFSPPNEAETFGRYFAAEAIQFVPTRLRVQMIRRRILDWEEPVEFRLQFGDELTPELLDNLTAAELQAALEALPGLGGKVLVIGKGSSIDETTYAPQQHHILFSDEVTAAELLTLDDETPGNVRLWSDWWIPTEHVATVWTALPNSRNLEPGAFGFCYPFDVMGWSWIHGECLTLDD